MTYNELGIGLSDTFHADFSLPIPELTFHAGNTAGDVLRVMGTASPDGNIENDEVLSLLLSTADRFIDIVFPGIAEITIASPDSE